MTIACLMQHVEADFNLSSSRPINGRVTARSALSPQAGQIVEGGNNDRSYSKPLARFDT